MKEIECIITGKVQGVGYRDFVMRHARALWLTGVVKNVKPGTVTVIAQGPEDKLSRFIEHLRKGPFLARVRDVEVMWREPQDNFKDFSILF